MQEKSIIKKRILQYLEYKDISKYKFYRETGITRGILDQNNGISEDNTARFLAHYKEVSPEWLLTGKGPMLSPTYKIDSTENNENIAAEPEEEYQPKKSTKKIEEEELSINKLLRNNNALTEANNALAKTTQDAIKIVEANQRIIERLVTIIEENSKNCLQISAGINNTVHRATKSK